MSRDAAERLARALLFEGYVLYPYRASSLKNRQRWGFGTLYPPAFVEEARAADASTMQTECLVEGEQPVLELSVRFLQLGRPRAGSGTLELEEAIERRLELPPLRLEDVAGDAVSASVLVGGAAADGAEAPGTEPARAAVHVTVDRLTPSLFKVRVVVANESDVSPGLERADAQRYALVSTHTLLSCGGGAFVSLLEPEPEYAEAAARCDNRGTWPVLVGAPGHRGTLLSSPIILYDYPRIADESAGDLFDSTEIDEILSLRILTLTDAEKREMAAASPRTRALLERTDSLGEAELLRLHGAWRTLEKTPLHAFAPGDHVVIRPRAGADVLDLALAGEAATVASVEMDLEGRTYFTVTVDRDPGRDLGLLGQPGHRFFFGEDELERTP